MSLHSRLVDEAKSYIGVTESGGDNHGKDVENFQRAVDGKAQGESWCMAFVQFCIRRVIDKTMFPATEHCLTAWNKANPNAKYALDSQDVRPGFVVIWRHGLSMNGHTGIVTAVSKDSFETVEGNTSMGSGIERNGDGVYARSRSRFCTGTMKVVGFIDPFFGCPDVVD